MTLVRDQGGSVAAAISVLAIYIMLFEKYLKQSADGLGALGKKSNVRVAGCSCCWCVSERNRCIGSFKQYRRWTCRFVLTVLVMVTVMGTFDRPGGGRLVLFSLVEFCMVGSDLFKQ